MHFFIFLHFWNFAWRVHMVVSRKIKYKTWNFQVFFKSSLLYLKFILSLWPSTYCCCPVQSYFISYMIIFHDFKSDMMKFGMQWADKSGIYKFPIQRRSLFGKSDILKNIQIGCFFGLKIELKFNSVLGPKKQHICLLWDFWGLNFCFKFCVMLRHQSAAKVN